jgi:LysM repeat protein
MLARPLLVALAACAILPACAGAAVHTVAPGETLWGVAMANGLPTASLAAANGLSPDARVIVGTNLTIPVAGTSSAGIAAPSVTTAPASGGSIRVAPGDSLGAIAARQGVSIASLAAANGLSPNGILPAGSALRLPAPGTGITSTTSASSAAGSAGAGSYRVVPGDSLGAIAARQGVSTASLAAANGLSIDGLLPAGRVLRLPAAGSSPTATSSAGGAPVAMGAYKVRPGDTLSGLAAASRVPVAQMAFMNGLSPSAHIIAGTVLKLPTGAAVTSSVPAPAQTIVPQAPPVASAGRLSATEVGSLAAQQGAPGSLAAAIAWQESGFNNAMISPANARGIMQILPGTWDWVQANLASGHLDPSSPSDNVRAGSLYLSHLLRETGGDPATAAAAYYQGLDSVRRIGMLPETQRYVANVMALRSRFGG